MRGKSEKVRMCWSTPQTTGTEVQSEKPETPFWASRNMARTPLLEPSFLPPTVHRSRKVESAGVRMWPQALLCGMQASELISQPFCAKPAAPSVSGIPSVLDCVSAFLFFCSVDYSELTYCLIQFVPDFIFFPKVEAEVIDLKTFSFYNKGRHLMLQNFT